VRGGKICGVGGMYYTAVYMGCIPPPCDALVLDARSTRFPTKSNSVAVGVQLAQSLASHARQHGGFSFSLVLFHKHFDWAGTQLSCVNRIVPAVIM
jgi:hypothetical protein